MNPTILIIDDDAMVRDAIRDILESRNHTVEEAQHGRDGLDKMRESRFDLVITDGDGVDVLNGLGANLSNAVTTQKSSLDGLGVVKSSLLTCTGSNMGDVKGAQAILYILDIDKA